MEEKSLETTSLDVPTIVAETIQPKNSYGPPTQTQSIEVEDPHSWPIWKKVFHTMVPAFYGFTVTLGSSIYSPGMAAIAHRFGVSREVAVLGLSLYTEGLAIGPMVGAPISEALGRKGIYLITGPLFVLFTIGAGLAQNMETLIICRFIAAIFGSPALAVGAGTVTDIWDMQSTGAVVSILLVSTFFLGPSIGPMIGGYTFETRHSWRWLMWALVLAAGPVLLISLFTEETSMKHRQQRQAKKKKKLGNDSNTSTTTTTTPSKATMKTLFTVTLFTPVKMLFKEPIVTAWALYHSFCFGVLFGFFGSYYYVFMTVYHFTLSEVGLAFLGVFLGISLSILVFALVDKLIYQRKRRRFADGKPPPEERLYACMLGAPLMPLSLFWFAWSARPDVHWMSPVAAGVPFGCGMLLLFVGGITYLMDTYGPIYAASAMAANGMMRYTFAMAFPLFVTQMYVRLGIPWATSLLGFVSVGMLPIPFVLYKYGPGLRGRSVFVGTGG